MTASTARIGTQPDSAGFADPVFNAQASFSRIMDAMANPGRVEKLTALPQGPAGLWPATAAVALTLLDQDMMVWLDETIAADDHVAPYLAFHTGCRFVEAAERAHFAIIGDPGRCLDFSRFAQGTLEYPDRSTTLIVQLTDLLMGQGFTLEGPGIAGRTLLDATPLPSDFVNRMRDNRARFPQGVDIIFCCGDRIAALPRSTRVAA